jgi:hypothetical protein
MKRVVYASVLLNLVLLGVILIQAIRLDQANWWIEFDSRLIGDVCKEGK